jgi:cell wall assembly regulator SMI1
MSDVWSEIVGLIGQISPAIAATLRPPASRDKVLGLEDRIGQPVPEAFRSCLLAFDGQDIAGQRFPLVGHNRFLGVDEMLELMSSQCDLFLDEAVPDAEENKIRPVIWDRLWIPFAELDGQMLILDLNPGKHGTVGQVVQYWPGFDISSDSAVCATSFLHFSDELLRRLREGEFKYEGGALIFEATPHPWVV